VEDSHNYLNGRAVLSRMLINRNATAVVYHPDATVLKDGYLNVVAVSREGFINRVVHYFIDKMMQAALTGGTDIHTRALPNRLEAFKNSNV